MLNFEGKVALVTGGGRGLGRSHAELLASRGAAVLVSDMDAEAADEAAAAIVAAGGRAASYRGDVTADAEGIVKAAVDAFGKLDIVVNNAGIDQHTDFDENAMAQTRRHMEVNFLGTVAVTAAAWPHLVASGAGRVVSTASPTLSGWEGESPYVASKGALFAWTRTVSIEALKKGIRVNAIAPTAYTRLAEAADIPDSLKEHLKENMTTAMVSPVVAYLASDECAVAGETILAQGGLIQRFSLAMNDGYTNPQLTPEDVQANLSVIVDDATAKPLGIIGTESETSLLDLFED
ncbi:MAG: SDR family NAD(P)-dependent oxidoreductase [Gordonia sp. (in: high G+C Gram-positive bacteria)]|uniref:SDR family NAD(P)-dependent oxidoreductase n=1 Tax=Gordonia sp. (in: high G+C Gram-positive bacteria) TaxID=84139 RepID=UPI0039E7263E